MVGCSESTDQNLAAVLNAGRDLRNGRSYRQAQSRWSRFVLNAGRDLRNGRKQISSALVDTIKVLNAGRDLRNGRL